MSTRPNVIYILSDDQRIGLLGCEDHPFIQTPNIDALAREGTRFSQAYCTSPLCTPSRACHYMGQWERRHAVNFNSEGTLSTSSWEDSFVGRLKAEGYHTAWIGKNHVPVGDGGYASGYFESWFDCWWGNHNHSSFYPKEQVNDIGAIYRNAKADTQAEVFAEGALNVLDPQPDFMASAPASFRPRPKDSPFCLCVTFNLPHGASCSTMQLRPRDDELYRSGYREHIQSIEMPKTWKSWKASHAKLPREVYNNISLPDYDYVKTPQTLQERIIRQCQVITGIDRFIGQLRQTLEKIGEAENTIIVYSTDHGLFFGEHGLGGKALLYEQALRIPLIIQDPRPDAVRGQVCSHRVAVPDLAPTVLDLCGLVPSTAMDGASLTSILRGDDTPVRDTLFVENLFDWQNYPRCEGILQGPWKYLRYFKRMDDPAHTQLWLKNTCDRYAESRLASLQGEEPVYEEVYNLEEDPQEERNLLPGGVNPDLLAQFRQDCTKEGLRVLGGVTVPGTSPRLKAN